MNPTKPPRSRWFPRSILSVLAISGLSGAAAPDKRPNILLIYADDQSYKTVGCYPGSFPWVRTPNIDALARRGVRFEGAYLGSWCMPSRAAMLTGRHPHAIESMKMEGTYPGSSYDPAVCRFWPSEFRKHGYQTAQIGKWHTGTDTGFGRDWDRQIVWNRPKFPDNAGNYYDRQILSFDGGKETLVEGYSTDNYTKWAADYIRGERRDPNKPWYLWLCYGAIHGPSIPAARHLGKYREGTVPTPADIFPPRPGKPAYLGSTQSWFLDPTGLARMGKSGEKFGDDSEKNPRTLASFVRQMNECVPAIDEGVGRLIAALKETGQLENTLVIYTADQGFAMGEHGFRMKLAPYEANYKSPLIISRPGTIPEGKVCSQTLNAPDLVTTFFATADIPLPWRMHGRDVTPLLLEPEKTDTFGPTLYEHFGEHYGSDVSKRLSEKRQTAHNNVPWYVAIRDGRHKYVRTLVEGETEEIYDLRSDPEELVNLAGKPEGRDLLPRLRSTAIAELKKSDADFLENLPDTLDMKQNGSR